MFRRETLLSRCIVLEILAANLLISLGYGRLFHFLFFRLYCPQVNKIRKIDSAVTIDSLVSGFSECEPVSAPESPLWRCCFLTLTAGPWTWLCVSHGWFRHSSANCWTYTFSGEFIISLCSSLFFALKSKTNYLDVTQWSFTCQHEILLLQMKKNHIMRVWNTFLRSATWIFECFCERCHIYQ